MIGGINLRQVGFISDGYDASTVDSVEDYRTPSSMDPSVLALSCNPKRFLFNA